MAMDCDTVRLLGVDYHFGDVRAAIGLRGSVGGFCRYDRFGLVLDGVVSTVPSQCSAFFTIMILYFKFSGVS
jgi:hypothetical protein